MRHSSHYSRDNIVETSPKRYLLATCVFTPLYGRLCNVMGRRGANQLAILFAGLGNLACGLSGNMEMLIAARFVRAISVSIGCASQAISRYQESAEEG